MLVDAGTVGTLDPSPCTTTPASTSSCQANTIPCSTASDCPSAWTCAAQAQPATEICAGPISLDGAVPACGTPDAAPAQMLCEPPYAGLGVSPGAGSSLSAGGSAPVPALAQNAATGDAGGSPSGAAAPAGSSGGCQVVAPGATPGAASVLALLGLSALARRRRSRS
jgi:MYXO-CTERM domain-containing protein